MSNWQQTSIGTDDGLGPNRRQAIILNKDDIVYWRIYASLGVTALSYYHWHCLFRKYYTILMITLSSLTTDTPKTDNSLRLGDAYMRHLPSLSLVQIMARHLSDAKPLSEHWRYRSLGTNSSQIVFKIQTFSFGKMHLSNWNITVTS